MRQNYGKLTIGSEEQKLWLVVEIYESLLNAGALPRDKKVYHRLR